jgi:hypothetical protein
MLRGGYLGILGFIGAHGLSEGVPKGVILGPKEAIWQLYSQLHARVGIYISILLHGTP